MAENEKQEGQKTVVAFIAGLLIGGLLVWVFSSSPEQAPTTVDTTTNTNNTTETNTTREPTPTTDNQPSGQSTTQSNASTPAPVTGDGNIVVADQAAGTVVMLDSTSFPATNGWVAVRDYEDGVAGNILGAARYETEVGLVPESVQLLRATEAGQMYQVLFYTENGDKAFDLTEDAPVSGTETTFTAQ